MTRDLESSSTLRGRLGPIKSELRRQRRLMDFRLRRLTAPIRMLPDFLIIGAQKSGTTSLFNLLVTHPSIGESFEKEVRYFNNHFDEGPDWYKAHFPSRPYKWIKSTANGPRFLTGEGEPSYLANPAVPQRVLDLVPDVRLIVMLRNPVDRAYSHYQHRFSRNREARTFEEVCEADKKILANGWENMPRDDLVRLGHSFYSYLPRGFYYDQLRAWLRVFPREQFLIIRAEDFFSDTQRVFDETLAFLGVPAVPIRKKKKKHNVGAYTDSMSSEMRRSLTDYFAPHNRKLYELLGRDFDWK